MLMGQRLISHITLNLRPLMVTPVAFVCLFAATACGGPEEPPDVALETFYAAVARGDASACDLLLDDAVKEIYAATLMALGPPLNRLELTTADRERLAVLDALNEKADAPESDDRADCSLAVRVLAQHGGAVVEKLRFIRVPEVRIEGHKAFVNFPELEAVPTLVLDSGQWKIEKSGLMDIVLADVRQRE